MSSIVHSYCSIEPSRRAGCSDEATPDKAIAEIKLWFGSHSHCFRGTRSCGRVRVNDEMALQLIRLRESICDEYEVGDSLQERLAAAVREEQYELAAKLRDELARRQELDSF